MGVEHLRQFAVVVLHPVPLIHDHVLPADLWEQEGQGWWELGGVDVPRVACNGSVMLEQLKEVLRGEYGESVPPHQETCSGMGVQGIPARMFDSSSTKEKALIPQSQNLGFGALSKCCSIGTMLHLTYPPPVATRVL